MHGNICLDILKVVFKNVVDYLVMHNSHMPRIEVMSLTNVAK